MVAMIIILLNGSYGTHIFFCFFYEESYACEWKKYLIRFDL